MIELIDVSKRYGAKAAVSQLNLKIEPGELFAFLGPNGAGKTTTIKMICGLLYPTSGTVRVGGFDMVTHGDSARLLMSYLPDVPFLYEKLTGREFLQFIADMYGLSRSAASLKIAEVIDLFELRDFVDDLTERYSHGMRQRTVFASSLIHDPKVLIVDEPTVGLDPASVRKLKNILIDQTKRGTTVFLSTHSLDIVQELAGRIGIIHQGRMISCGSVEELRKQAMMDGSLEEVFLKLTEEESTVTQ